MRIRFSGSFVVALATWSVSSAIAAAANPPGSPSLPVPPVSTQRAPVSSQQPLPAQQIDALVRDLGAQSFAQREQAAHELTQIGIAAKSALERASQSTDAEVRLRARSILRNILTSDFQARLEAFAADYDGASGVSLPAWEQFSTRFGDNRMARQLFVEMQRAEPELLEAYAESPAIGGDMLNQRVGLILDGQRESLAQLGTLATLLFVAGADDVRVDEDGCLHIFPFVVQSTYHRNNKSPLWPSILKKLVGGWIAKDTTPSMTNQNLTLAAQLEMKNETLSIASRVLESKTSLLASRQISILMIGRFGEMDDLARIEHLLKDTTSCGMVQLEDSSKQVELQIRDIALAAMLHMTGQDLHDYGYHSVKEFGPTVFQLGTLGFDNSEAREVALRRWAEWRAEHPAS